MKKLIFAKNALCVNRSNFEFYSFFQEKESDCSENLHTYSEKLENKKIKVLEIVKKIKNIPIKDGGSP